jgi:hypothetical protein
VLKEIELVFENGYFFTEFENMFPKFCRENKMRIKTICFEK